MQRKELDYIDVEGLYGGNQELFSDLWMNVGGCAAVAACDLSIWMDLHRGTGLYPFSAAAVTKADYEKFAMIMKPYLRPRWQGVSKLWMFTEGYGNYLADCGCTAVTMKTVDGSESTETAVRAVREQIDSGIPAVFLNLNHQDPEYEDYVWHWFMLTGYEDAEDGLRVKTASCGVAEWISFQRLWESGFEEKGGMVLPQAETAGKTPGDAARCLKEGRFLTLEKENRLGEYLEHASECAEEAMKEEGREHLYIFFLRLLREELQSATEEDIRKASEDQRIRDSLRADQNLMKTMFREEGDSISLLNTLVLYLAYRRMGYPDHSPEFMRTVGVFRRKIEAYYKKEVQHVCG